MIEAVPSELLTTVRNFMRDGAYNKTLSTDKENSKLHNDAVLCISYMDQTLSKPSIGV